MPSINDNDGDGSVHSDGLHTGNPSNAATTDLERATLAHKENVTVKWMRGAVFLVLFVTALLVSGGAYTVTRKDQRRDFESAFKADALKLLGSFNAAVERRLESIDALSVSITAYARDTNSTFPNVTISDFEIRCANIRILSDTAMIQYYPIVVEETRKGWEEYQWKHQDHFDKSEAVDLAMIQHQDNELGRNNSRRLQDTLATDSRQITAPGANATLIGPAPPNRPYLPMWQFSPVIPAKQLLNFNILTNPAARAVYMETMQTGKVVVDAASNLNAENLEGSGDYWRMILSMSQYRHNLVNDYLGDPLSVVGVPVFDSFDLARRKVVAILGTNFYWRFYFDGVLPSNTKGIICVLENTKGQNFTYRIDDQVSYLGEGDHHDPAYDHLEESSDMATYLANIQSPETKSYTSVEFSEKYCNYKLRIYPSQDNENVFVNSSPMWMSLTILFVFIFTSVVFVLYTIAVGRRQEVVMNRAVASSAIVSSLFPSQVRDQIYQENEDADRSGTKPNVWKRDGQVESVTAPTGRPIAQLFENTTIMFADMVGFTQWSSKRTPVQVFELLETIYKAFDTIAIRRKVFKVETIGDCYVAVAGLPDPQDDHAIIMAKFADDCMAKMSQLTTELAEVLGADTAGLKLRVGLHSGSVTGGVLRGEKSRFQLFGDTMNTASRMESNGAPGRIHASYETIMELGAKGKSNWVTARDDMIVVKGKGQLQTYWVSPRAMAGSVMSARTYGTTSVDESLDDEVVEHKGDSIEI